MGAFEENIFDIQSLINESNFRNKLDLGDFVIDAPNMPYVDINIGSLRVNSEIVEMTQRYYNRPDYVSYDYYKTTELWFLILYVNDCKDAAEFTIDKFYVPNLDTVVQLLMNHRIQTQKYDVKIGYLPKDLSISNLNLRYPKVIVTNTEVTFSAEVYNPAGSRLVYDWSFGDGNVQRTFNRKVTHSYNQSGNFAVFVSVTDEIKVLETSSIVYVMADYGPLISSFNVNVSYPTRVKHSNLLLPNEDFPPGCYPTKVIGNVTYYTDIPPNWIPLETTAGISVIVPEANNPSIDNAFTGVFDFLVRELPRDYRPIFGPAKIQICKDANDKYILKIIESSDENVIDHIDPDSPSVISINTTIINTSCDEIVRYEILDNSHIIISKQTSDVDITEKLNLSVGKHIIEFRAYNSADYFSHKQKVLYIEHD